MNRDLSLQDKLQGITIFTVPKPFQGHIGIIQHNAIKSWTLLRPQPEIILFGDEKGTADIAAELNLHHVPHVKCNELGTPFVNDFFMQAQDIAKNNILLFINSDNILMSDLVPAVQRVCLSFTKFLIVGARWGITISSLLNFEHANWEDKLRGLLVSSPCSYKPYRIDYLVFSKYLWPEIPPFVVGRARFNRWLLYQALVQEEPAIDVSQVVLALHQAHHYNHFQGGKNEAYSSGVEAQRNIKLAGGDSFPKFISLFSATWELTPFFLVRRSSGSPLSLEMSEPFLLNPRLKRLFFEALSFLFLGKADLALKLFDAVLKLNNDFLQCYYYHALSLLQLGRKDEAISTLKTVLVLRPDYERALNLIEKISST